MKICKNCNINKLFNQFYSDKSKIDGLSPNCKVCKSHFNKKHKLNNKEKYQKQSNDYYNKNKQIITIKSKLRYKLNASNRKSRTDTVLRYYKKFPEKANVSTSNRRAMKLKRTPTWLTIEQINEMRDMYKLAQELQWLSEEKLHVDHIIPLKGKNVSGLHVPWNLQILPASMNTSKGNKFIDITKI